MFELRKVGYAKVANVHSITALMFIENIFDTQGDSEEVSRVRKDRIAQLEQLSGAGREPVVPAAERGYYLYQLGLALKEQKELERAHKALQEAKALGASHLGAELYRSVVDALQA